MHRPILSSVIVLIAAGLLALPAAAQLNGHNFRGDFGLSSGTQPPPGWWLSVFYAAYDTDTVRDQNGDRIRFDPQRRGSIRASGIIPYAWWVSEKQVLGGTYSFSVAPSLTDAEIEAPIFGLDQRTSYDLGDLYIQPINLGWHKDRADYTAGLGIYVPVGKYQDGADDNTGLGMWSYELFAGGTWYLDAARSWNLALTAFWETHSEKEGSDQKVGDLLTLEGGLGKSFIDGAINVGVAYYGQWKLSADDLGFRLPIGSKLGKHQVFGVGPEIVFPIAVKQKLIALLTARYLFEFDAESTTEGDTLFVGLTFPVGVDFGS